MMQDPVKKGVWLHPKCADQYSPWQLPMQIVDNYVLERARPDAYLTYNYYIVNDSSPVLITETVYPYPENSFAAGSSFKVASQLMNSNDDTPLQSGPDEPKPNQVINLYVPPSQRNR
jgi:hypothetical protein